MAYLNLGKHSFYKTLLKKGNKNIDLL